MIKINDKYFMLFSCCIPVKGARRSIICDLQRNSFRYIANEFYELLNQKNFIDIDSISTMSTDEIKGYIQYLLEEEYAFMTKTPELFPNIDFTIDDFPESLKNIIIDFDESSSHNLKDISQQLSALRCSAIEMRFFCKKTLDELITYLKMFDISTIRTLNLVIKHTEEMTLESLSQLCFNQKRVKQIIVYGSPDDQHHKIDFYTSIILSKEIVTNETHCGNISPHYFQSNLNFFKESLLVNSCLHKKLGIDTQGNIKNCPSMKKVYGHISKDSLIDIIENKQFKAIGKIKKDNIEVCKDCEFRYICLDCRAYQDQDHNYFKPKKCSYDPYQTKWC